jgi:cytochrome b involved in lipid metabolism
MVVKRLIFAAFVAFLASAATIAILARLSNDRPAVPEENSISPADATRHNTAGDCWMIIDGGVYDVSKYIPLHPTAPDVMTRWCGKDATEAFATKGDGSPHSPTARTILKKYAIGKSR